MSGRLPGPAAASEQSTRGSRPEAGGEAGCRRAGAPRRVAGPSTAFAPIGCWIREAGRSASPGSWRGRWGRRTEPGRVLMLPAVRADPRSPFLCPASSPLRGSSFSVAAAAARCRCTRIPQTPSSLRCQVIPVVPARPLGFPAPGGWGARSSEEFFSLGFRSPGGDASGEPLRGGLGSARRVFPVLPPQPSPP